MQHSLSMESPWTRRASPEMEMPLFPPPRRKTTITKVLTYFSNPNGSPFNGSAVFISECSGVRSQRWAIKNTALTSYDGTMCLDVPNGDDSNGVEVQLWKCLPNNPSQQWARWINESYFVWVGHNRCLDLTDGDFTNGNRVQISDCIKCVEAFNVCLITDSRILGATAIKARFVHYFSAIRN